MGRSLGWLKVNAIFCALLLLSPTSLLIAQTPEQAPVTVLSADQLDDLVAPIALYPDELLGQVLAASTYPLELVEAQQWLLQNRALQGPQLMDAAKRQSWDPSVQAMVAFPDVLTLLNRDVRWTTDLGNAFLAQQADVMNAVQRMRSRASENGRLTSTPQQTVTENQSAIEIQPTNPQVIYVPSYNPQYVWGPPAGGAYPSLGYGYGFGFNPGVLIGALFSGLMSFGGWGWGLNWLAHALFLNNLFFGHFGFGGFGGGLGARSSWIHNPAHRMGVAYSNRMVASRFSSGRSAGARSFNSAPHAPTGGWQRAGQSRAYSTAAPRSYGSLNRGVDGSRYNSPGQSYRASSSNYRSPASSYRAPASHYSAPKMNSHNSAPRSSHMKAPHMSSPRGHSSGHSSGGHGGKHK